MQSIWEKRYFLLCCVAAGLGTALWSGALIFVFTTHRAKVSNVSFCFFLVVFFAWGAKQMYDGYRDKP